MCVVCECVWGVFVCVVCVCVCGVCVCVCGVCGVCGVCVGGTICVLLQTLPLAEINQTFKLSAANPLEVYKPLKTASQQSQASPPGRV